ncbi:MAG: ribonuclease P protein component 1 [Candidatus Asgardarchaeia archaeon]
MPTHMKITPHNIVNHELIGLNVYIVRHANPNSNNIKGIVIFETKNMLIIKKENGKIIKVTKNGIFRFTLPDKTVVEVDGNLIKYRPEDRLKRVFRRKW